MTELWRSVSAGQYHQSRALMMYVGIHACRMMSRNTGNPHRVRGPMSVRNKNRTHGSNKGKFVPERTATMINIMDRFSLCSNRLCSQDLRTPSLYTPTRQQRSVREPPDSRHIQFHAWYRIMFRTSTPSAYTTKFRPCHEP